MGMQDLIRENEELSAISSVGFPDRIFVSFPEQRYHLRISHCGSPPDLFLTLYVLLRSADEHIMLP